VTQETLIVIVLKIYAMADIRPWRKLKLQFVSAEKWIAVGEEVVDGALAQVGGHGAWDKDQTMQVNKKGLVLKPVAQDVRGKREVEFFQTVFNSTDPKVKVFADFLPYFHGVNKKKRDDGSLGEFLMMENLTNNFSKPCIMDVKIGARTYGPDAKPEKMKQQDASYTGTKVPYGFSVPGLSVHCGDNKDTLVVKDKSYGKTLNKDNIDELLELYLDTNTDIKLAQEVAKLFTEELQKIAALFASQTQFHFFASSLLFVYDAEGVKNNKDMGPEHLRKFINLKMIDFAHVWPAEDKLDENYSRGVMSLIELFSKV